MMIMMKAEEENDMADERIRKRRWRNEVIVMITTMKENDVSGNNIK